MGGPVNDLDVEGLAPEILDALGGDAVVSSLGIYGNPLQDEQCAKDWERVVKAAKLYGCSVVCGFAGALEDRPVDESMPKFGEVFGRIAKVADGEGVKIAFENCDMGGTWQSPRWNIAHAPRAWEMMFDAVPGDTLGLEWEPCHQMVSLIDPIPQLRQWAKRVYHVHGKDATLAWDVIEREGIRSGASYVWHRTPGFGDTNWSDVITILRMNGFRGAIDIEGWHDPIYRDELEMTGQVFGMEYLKSCRGGEFVPNPPD
jgi:sugar phosphate isomerase/epimerase